MCSREDGMSCVVPCRSAANVEPTQLLLWRHLPEVADEVRMAKHHLYTHITCIRQMHHAYNSDAALQLMMDRVGWRLSCSAFPAASLTHTHTESLHLTPPLLCMMFLVKITPIFEVTMQLHSQVAALQLFYVNKAQAGQANTARMH